MSDDVTATATADKKFQPHPEGQFVAVCVDTINLGDKLSNYPGAPAKLKPACALVFRTGEQNENGDHIDLSQEFTVSMFELAKLRKFLESWRGKSYTDEQAEAGVQLSKMVGHPALVSVEHKVSGKGRTYAVISTIAPLPKQMKAPAFPAYERPKFWEERKETYKQEAEQFRKAIGAPKATPAPSSDDSGSDLPF